MTPSTRAFFVFLVALILVATLLGFACAALFLWMGLRIWLHAMIDPVL